MFVYLLSSLTVNQRLEEDVSTVYQASGAPARILLSLSPQPPPPTPPVTAQKRCRTDTDLTALASNSPFPSTCCVPSIPMVSNSAVTNAQDTPTAQLGASNSCPPSLEKDSCVPTVSASPSTSMPDIPAYHAAADITFSWDDLDPTSFCQSLKEAYAETVHWKKNLFKVPLGNVGKSFVAELSRLYNVFASGSALESIALMAVIVLPILVLQSPHRRSRVKEHITCLERRLKLWKAGDLASLIKEGRTLQQRLPKSFNMQQDKRLARDHLPTSCLKGRHMLP